MGQGIRYQTAPFPLGNGNGDIVNCCGQTFESRVTKPECLSFFSHEEKVPRSDRESQE